MIENTNKRSLIQPKTVYEVNGKTFNTMREAEAEAQNVAPEVVLVANSMYHILQAVSRFGLLNYDGDIMDVKIEVKDKKLHLEWYKDKPYAEVFIKLLGELGIKFKAEQGDEMISSKFHVYPKELEKQIWKADIVDYIDKNLPLIAEEKSKRVQKILKDGGINK